MNYFQARQIDPGFYADHDLPLYLKNSLPKKKDAPVLDFGCGFGQNLKALKKLGYSNIAGSDIDEAVLAHCSSIGLEVANSSNLDAFVERHARKYEFIIMSHVLEHIPKDAIVPALTQIKRLLTSDGRLAVMVPNAQSSTNCYWAYEDFTHATLFTAGSLYYVLKMAGFEKIEFIDVDCTCGMPWHKRFVKRSLLALYRHCCHGINRITSSSYHRPSPEIFSFEIKALAI